MTRTLPLFACIAFTVCGCATTDLDSRVYPNAIDASTVSDVWKTDKPEIRRLVYDLIAELIDAEADDRWIVPSEPVVIDEIRTTRDIQGRQFERLAKRHKKLCKLADVYYAPGWGVVHRKTKQQAWVLRLTIRYSNNGRMYMYDYSFHHGLEAAHGGSGRIAYDEKKKTFVIEKSSRFWQS